MATNRTCVRAIPYEVGQDDNKSMTMYLYIHAGNEGISENLRKSADEMLSDYTVEFVDLERRPLSNAVVLLPSSEKTKKTELSDLAEVIDKNLSIFENRLNVTAVQPSYRVVNGQEISDLCVTVFVLGKGKIPIGESDFSEVKQLNNYPFDIVEGYYVPTSFPFRSKAFPLYLGVGISTSHEQCQATGTLGAFVVEGSEHSSTKYILSCDHVLKNQSTKVGTEIVQPSTEDYNKDVEEHNKDIDELNKEWTRRKNRQDGCIDSEEREKWKRRTELTETKRTGKRADLETLEQSGIPRVIASYSWGVRRNVKKTVQRNGHENGHEREFWVDAAVAELKENEVKEIIDVEDGTVYGFCRKEPIHDEIVPVASFEEEEEGVTFRKSGRTTRYTEGGQLKTQHFNVNQAAFKKEVCFGICTHVHFQAYCNKCATESNVQQIVEVSKIEREKISCSKCKGKIEENQEKPELWCRNCFTIGKRASKFSDHGDSGALVYDNEGRPWGIITGGFFVGDAYRSVAFSLDVALEALSEESGKQLRLWCVEER